MSRSTPFCPESGVAPPPSPAPTSASMIEHVRNTPRPGQAAMRSSRAARDEPGNRAAPRARLTKAKFDPGRIHQLMTEQRRMVR